MQGLWVDPWTEGTRGPRWRGSTGTSTCRGVQAGAGQRLGRVRVETGATHTESRGERGATPPPAEEQRVRRDTAGARAESEGGGEKELHFLGEKTRKTGVKVGRGEEKALNWKERGEVGKNFG